MHPADHVQNKIFMKTIFHFLELVISTHVDKRERVSYACSIKRVEISLLVVRQSSDLLIDVTANFRDLLKQLKRKARSLVLLLFKVV